MGEVELRKDHTEKEQVDSGQTDMAGAISSYLCTRVLGSAQ